MENALYEHVFYLIKETRKPKYLDFYELDDKDLKSPEFYLEETIRHNGKWYFITTSKQYFRSEELRAKAPRVFIKHLYKAKEAVL
jgi:hypothetical protein